MPSQHWKHRATRCAVVGCERTRKKGWSTCTLLAHYHLGKSLYGAGRIEPIEEPKRPSERGPTMPWWAEGSNYSPNE